MSNAALRILTALVGAPLFLGALYLGGWPFGLVVVALCLLAQYELYVLLERAGLQPYKVAGLAIGGVAVLWPLTPKAFPLALAGSIALLLASPFTGTEKPLHRLCGTLLGILYPSILFSFILGLRLARGPAVENLEAFLLTFAVILLIWATDTLAYVVGKNLGRNPLAPRISPKKTWEGSVGGALGALCVMILFKLTFLDFLAWTHAVVVALICGVVSQLGDLAESQIKRAVDVKDSGTLLPGHGGLLDRFDAMIVAMPLAYLYLALVGQLVLAF